jgi:hypothetical protein
LDVELANGLVWLADSSALRVIDVGNPTTPVEIGSLATSCAEAVVDVSGSRAYVGGNHLCVVDVSNPSLPVELGKAFVNFGGIEVFGSLAYLSSNGLRILDVSDPDAPVQIGWAAAPDSGRGVAVRGTSAFYVGAPDEGGECQHVADVSDPTAPIEIRTGSCDTGASDVELAGGLVWAAADGAVFVSGPTAPFTLGAFNTGDYPQKIAVVGSLVYATGGGTLRVIDFGPEYVPEPARLLLQAAAFGALALLRLLQPSTSRSKNSISSKRFPSGSRP